MAPDRGVVGEVWPVVNDGGHYPVVYLPLGQEWLMTAGTIIARVKGAPTYTIQQLKAAVSASAPGGRVYGTRLLVQAVDEILYPRRLAGAVLSAAGLLGLLIASVGLYGVVSSSVAQRTREIGVRTALGADRRHVERLVMTEGWCVTAIGAVLGTALLYPAIRTATVFGLDVPPLDVLTMAGVTSVVALVVALACWIPARRAAAVDPLVALRYE